MLPSRTVLSTLCYRRRCCVYLGLLVFIRAAFCVNGSFGNLVTRIIYGSPTTASPSGTDIVNDADPVNKCVTYSTSPGSSPYIDVGVGSNSDVRTILVYTRKFNPTPVTVPIVITVGSRYTFTHDFTPFHTDTNTVYVFTGIQLTSYVRVKAADPSANFTVCMVKVYDVSLSEYCTCDDPCSKNTDYICTAANVCTAPATPCHGQNVALNKKTEMSSTYKSDDGSFAVNGNTGTTFSGSGHTKDKTQWNCIHTAEGPSHYWQVDLGRSYNVAYLTIYRRGSGPGKERMRNVKVRVDDQLCTTLTDSQIEGERIDVTCTPPLSGQVVKLSRDGSQDYLNLCEVQVWECEPGYYGHRCTKECSSNCVGGRTACDVQGKCTNGCQDGWYGFLCHSNCLENCQDTRCNQTTGKCTCIDGWFGPTCDRMCSSNCLKCELRNNHCTHCGKGRYQLPACQTSCSSNCQNPECDTRTGNCSTCKAGWYSPNCTKPCSSGCQCQQCDQDTGGCSCKDGWKGDKCDECDDRHYGQDCREECGKCSGGQPCDKKSGRCPGECTPGWGPAGVCNKSCDVHTYGAGCRSTCGGGCKDACDRQTGQCDCKPGWKPANKCDKECENGRYGDNCNQTCGAGCSNVCDQTNGHCRCKEGWVGDTCHNRCNPGKYGTGCQQSCGEGCVAACNDQTGHCACRPGWVSHNSMCDMRCSGGLYGPGCNLTCGSCLNGSACEHDMGHCQQGCAEGFKGNTCHEIREGGADGWLVGVNAAVTLAVVIVVMVMTVTIRRYRKKRRHTPRETNEIEMMAAAASADSGAHQSYNVVTADSSVDTGRGSHFYEDMDTVRPAPLLKSRARDKTDRAEENYENLQPGTSQID